MRQEGLNKWPNSMTHTYIHHDDDKIQHLKLNSKPEISYSCNDDDDADDDDEKKIAQSISPYPNHLANNGPSVRMSVSQCYN